LLFSQCSTKSSENLEKQDKILFIVSNATTYGNTELSASNHFSEIVLAYDEFIKAGYDVDFVSPQGGAVTVGYLDTTSQIQRQYLADEGFMAKLKNTFVAQQVASLEYMAVYYCGGGAAMFGVPENKEIQNISMAIYENQNGIVSAICHGSAGLAYLKTQNGDYLVQGKRVNGFPDLFENKEAPYYATFPFSIEEKLKENGGDFSFSEEGWDDYSITDGRLITGQDPTAARSVAKQVIKALKKS
ncbi:MAG: type 1 glutamine amidotransferase domain-containing protein, partial [Ekhidna sp.]